MKSYQQFDRERQEDQCKIETKIADFVGNLICWSVYVFYCRLYFTNNS